MSKQCQKILSLCTLALLFSVFAVTGHAQERILYFGSNIQVYPDGQITVTETIDVQADGNNIRRGIYRDFPTRYVDNLGNAYRVDFQVISASRDGKPEQWRVENMSNGVRIYLGSADILLSPGQYSYQIQYATKRQIGFFEEHDELYWNVTGNGWLFPIETAGASVLLPEAVPTDQITLAGYTGPQGATGQSYTAEVFVGGGSIDTTRLLGPREGLTLVITWPKGLVSEPNTLQKFIYLLRDNAGLFLSFALLVSLLIYMYMTWSKVGRDPKQGVIFPHYEPPPGYSPASVRYIMNMKYDNKTLSSAIINLAVKGHLSISNNNTIYTLTKQSSTRDLSPGEEIIMLNLFAKEDSITLAQENQKQLLLTTEGHRSALRKDYLNKYFFRNTAYIWPPVIATILIIIIILVTDNLVPLTLFSFPVIFILLLFYARLMKAPTQETRQLMDKLEGFKLYLEVAEKDDLNLRHPPQLTPALFEKYLPFAIALGVEQAWAEKFNEVFAKLQQSGNHYHPLWYYGTFDSHHINNFSKNMGKEFSSAITSASTPPGSSSGIGGGGFSGGGGGGGGGGGW